MIVKGSYLKISYNVEYETISELFIYRHIKIHWSISCSLWMNLYQGMILTFCVVILKTLVCWVIQIFQMWTHLIIQYQKITPITWEIFRKLSGLWCWIQIFQNSNFHLKILNFITGNNYCELFPWKQQAYFVHFSNWMSATYSSLGNCGLSVSHPFK